jgi:hypothetical protein
MAGGTMRPGREIDVKVAEQVFGYEVFVKNRILHERTEKGDRPLRNYTKEIEWAWLVAEKMRISVVAIEGNQWFAFAASNEGWSGPDAFLTHLQSGQFDLCGAAVESTAAEAICKAAVTAKHKQSLKAESALGENSAIN